ncbi:MAG: hypothetical protein WCV00_00945 [Verrucomicrobiia bacterium]
MILKRVDAGTGLRVTEVGELRGLDVLQHGEEACNGQPAATGRAGTGGRGLHVGATAGLSRGHSL